MKEFDKKIVPLWNKVGLGWNKRSLEDTYEAQINQDLAYGTSRSRMSIEQKDAAEKVQMERAKAMNEKLIQKKKTQNEKSKPPSKVGFAGLNGVDDEDDIDTRQFGDSKPKQVRMEETKTAPKIASRQDSENDALKSDRYPDHGTNKDVQGKSKQSLGKDSQQDPGNKEDENFDFDS